MPTRLKTTVPAWLATLLAVLLIASGITMGATPAVAAAAPAVTVSVAPAEGGLVTVTGSGFAAASPGVYVGVGTAGAAGFYQAERGDTVWVAPTNEDGTSSSGRTAKLNADGTFSLTLTVAAPTEDVAAYAVYTSKAHGGGFTDPSQDTVTPVTFAEPEPEPIPAPTLAVSETSKLDPDGATITLTGTNIKTGFANRHGTGEAGVYAQVGYLDAAWRPSEGATSTARSYAASVWVKEVAPTDSYLAWTDNGNGTANFVWTTTVDYDTLVEKQRAGATLAVFTTGAGGVVQAANELAVPISFDLPTVTVSKTTNLDSTGEVVTVTGSGFLPHAPETTGARPPLAGKFGGTYIAFGKFADDWQPSSGAPGSSRVTSDVRWAVQAEDLPTISSMPGAVELGVDGTFEVTLTVKKGFSKEPAIGNYGIYTYSGSGAKFDRFETFSPISFAPLATDLTFTTTPAAKVTEGASITLNAQLASPTPGTVTFATGGSALGTVTPDAAGTATLVVPSLSVGTHTLTADFTPADPTSFVASSASLSFTVVEKPVVAAGSLAWGVKQSFRDYVTGSIAKGSISTTNVRSSGSAFIFGQSTGGTFNGSTGTSHYTGSVRFLGHGGILDLALGNPVVRVDSAASGTLLVRVNGSTVPFATLALGSGSKSTSGGAVSYNRVPATLTAQGAAAFVNGDSQFYPAGEALDPVSFTIGEPSSYGGGTTTLAAFVATTNGVPPTPPATTGATVVGTSANGIQEGGLVTITADGFEPNETGIKVVVYSDPVILATDAFADAAGVVTWTGVLPTGLTGEHTLTLQGSVDRGVVLTIAASSMMTSSLGGCAVTDATITWGFKEAFRSYVSGAIAHGEWAVADGATYDIPNFGWNDGAGSYDPQSGVGLLAFGGAVTFTGHGGVLNTTISNPQLRFDDAHSATLLLDVAGDTQDGVAVNQPGVEFATIDLAAAETETDAGAFTISAAPAVLTDDGSAAFGTYEPGTELDPITITFSTDADCAALVTAPADEVEQPVADSAGFPAWLLGVIIAAVLAAITLIVVLMARRRQV